MKILIIHFLNALLFLTLCSANDWPRFRGPTEDGHAKVKSLPLKWNATENVRWKVPVPGKGVVFACLVRWKNLSDYCIFPK